MFFTNRINLMSSINNILHFFSSMPFFPPPNKGKISLDLNKGSKDEAAQHVRFPGDSLRLVPLMKVLFGVPGGSVWTKPPKTQRPSVHSGGLIRTSAELVLVTGCP